MEIGKSVFNWSEVDILGYLVILDGNGASVNMVKQASAMITLLKEVTCLDNNIRLGFVTQVRRGCMKRAKDRDRRRRKKVRSVIRIDHIRLMIKVFYRRPAKKVAALDRRFLVKEIFLCFGMR